jgi:thiamine-monophosphate kinase
VERPNSDPVREPTSGPLDEFTLIERLRLRFEAAAGGGPPSGETWIGDDAAVVTFGGGPMVLTTDLVVGGVHVDLELGGPEDAGYKSLMVSLSDLAAMGARPRYALVSMAAPPGTELERVGAGVAEAAAEAGCTVVGGDLSVAPALVVSVAAAGVLEGGSDLPALLRSGAVPGDTLFVTGPLGGAAAGLRLRRETCGASAVVATGSGSSARLEARFLRPRARIAEGTVARRAGASAAIDVSDGLAADVARLGEASGVGIALDDVPVEPGATLEEALRGGEDYELVVATGSPSRLVAAFEDAGLGSPLPLGRCTVRAGECTLAGEPFEPVGWRHSF